ncbi:MAG: hypothetical protein WC352_03165 [Candidatus Omnitrophota bacterium]|jgi:hypothetical protein
MKGILVRGFLMIGILSLAVSCKAGNQGPVVRHNEQIDPKAREAVHRLNEAVIDSFRKNDPSAMMTLLADSVKKQPGITEKLGLVYGRLSPLFQNQTAVTENEYEIIRNNTKPPYPRVSSGTPEPFLIATEGAEKHSYMSFLTLPDGVQDFQFSLVYVREGDVWKLLVFHGGIVRVAGKSAVQWYKEAQGLFEKGSLISAALRLQIIQTCLRPAPFLEYEAEKEMVAFERTLQTGVLDRYKFPMTLKNLKSQPVVFSFEPEVTEKSVIPVILYVSTLPLAQKKALQKEIDDMAKEIKTEFKGLTDGVDQLYFRVFSEFPADPSKDYSFENMTASLNGAPAKPAAAPQAKPTAAPSTPRKAK